METSLRSETQRHYVPDTWAMAV